MAPCESQMKPLLPKANKLKKPELHSCFSSFLPASPCEGRIGFQEETQFSRFCIGRKKTPILPKLTDSFGIDSVRGQLIQTYTSYKITQIGLGQGGKGLQKVEYNVPVAVQPIDAENRGSRAECRSCLSCDSGVFSGLSKATATYSQNSGLLIHYSFPFSMPYGPEFREKLLSRYL